MLRTGRCNVVATGTATWSAGSTSTSAQTLALTLPASAGNTTLLHEIIFTTDWTADITADIRPVVTIGGASYNGDLDLSTTIDGVATVKGISVSAKHYQVRGLFNGGSAIVGLLPSASASATLTVNCIVQELEGT